MEGEVVTARPLHADFIQVVTHDTAEENSLQGKQNIFQNYIGKDTPIKLLKGHLQLQMLSISTLCFPYILAIDLEFFQKP